MGKLKFTNFEEVNKKDKGEQKENQQEGSKEEKERYHDKTKVNDIQIEVKWDDGYHDYVIYLPQIDLEYAQEEKPEVADQVIRIGTDDPDKAKSHFIYAKKTANRVLNAYDLYQKIHDKLYD